MRLEDGGGEFDDISDFGPRLAISIFLTYSGVQISYNFIKDISRKINIYIFIFTFVLNFIGGTAVEFPVKYKMTSTEPFKYKSLPVSDIGYTL